jgi:hypothetical protein
MSNDNSANPFKELDSKQSKGPKNGKEFLDALKKVQAEGEVSTRTKKWIEEVKLITEKDLKFIVQ